MKCLKGTASVFGQANNFTSRHVFKFELLLFLKTNQYACNNLSHHTLDMLHTIPSCPKSYFKYLNKRTRIQIFVFNMCFVFGTIDINIMLTLNTISLQLQGFFLFVENKCLNFP